MCVEISITVLREMDATNLIYENNITALFIKSHQIKSSNRLTLSGKKDTTVSLYVISCFLKK